MRDSIETLEGSAAPPRKNGEFVFDAPWESRAFGMAVVLQDGGAYSWQEFSARLAAEIAEHCGSDGPYTGVLPVPSNTEMVYYEHWLEALESLLIEHGRVSMQELEARTAEFAAGMWDHHER